MDQTEERVTRETTEKDGQIKCPKCGATDISTDIKTGKLRCNFCRHLFEPEKAEDSGDIADLEGSKVSEGAGNIVEDSPDVITLKCESCGAEVVVNTRTSTQARCHWCRNTLSINSKIPNGAVPDVVLPFGISKQEAQKHINEFVKKRSFFAHPTFTREFTTDNIQGVYFPYMIVDVNAHSHFSGTGERLLRSYTVKEGDREVTRYDAEAYHVERDFDIAIDDLTVEASSDKLNASSREKTTNIINSIMPFDTENCVKYNANYLKGFTSEKRDVNVDDVRPLAELQANDIARVAADETLGDYDRGVRWDVDNFTVKGQSWTAAYLPVWLYSYMQRKGDKKLLHYVAVNARTKETMGSVPINFTKLWIVSVIVEIFGALAGWVLGTERFGVESNARWLFLLSGLVFFGVMYMRYRNAGARHTYEKETKRNMSNLRSVDQFMESRFGLSNASLEGANSTDLKGANAMVNDEIVQKLRKKGLDPRDLQEKADRLN